MPRVSPVPGGQAARRRLARWRWGWPTAAAVLGLLLVLVPVRAPAAPAGAAPEAAVPRLQDAARLYEAGVLADGTPLIGRRADGSQLTGAEAACMACHRRSGLGTQEGRITIPPVTGTFLRQPRNVSSRQIDGLPGTHSVATFRPAFDAASLARAIRDGIGSDGQPLSLLMPRYALPAAQMDGLQAYLMQLGTAAQPGVDGDTLQFATIVTPDADPVARDAMLATLQAFFADRNHIIAGAARPMPQDARGVMYRVTRRWNLQVWTLRGPPATWAGQLAQWQREQPVFAVLSGVGGADWAPVHAFCESARVPCLFPNVDAPVAHPGDFYARYFSRGVFLEADLMLGALADPAGTAGTPPAGAGLVIVAHGALGLQGAQTLQAGAMAAGWPVQLRVLPEGPLPAGDLQRAVTVSAGQPLALWLDPADLAQLPAPPPAASRLLVSGLLGGLEDIPLPPAWRAAARITYPFELPARRALAMQFPAGWFRIRQVPLTAARVQFQTYLACQILSESVGELHVNLVPDYLLERLEVMLSHRQLNGLFPHLSLGAGQVFASKGGYLAQVSASQKLVADGGWQVP